MSAVLFDSDLFLNEIMPDVPGCSKEIAVNAIRNASIEFCKKSFVWMETLDPLNVVVNVDVYDVGVIPIGSVVERVNKLYYLGVELTASNVDEVNAKRQSAVGGAVKFYAQSSPTQVILHGMPEVSTTGALVMNVSLTPSHTSSGIDSSITDRYLDGIVSGAKSRLMLMPKKPWTDMALASYHKGEFGSAADTAMIDAARGFGRAPKQKKKYL